MKELSAKKIVLGAITFVACVVLLLSLSFGFYQIQLSSQLDYQGVATVFCKECGFDLLDFRTALALSNIFGNNVTEIVSQLHWLVVSAGVLSVITLICAVCGIVSAICGTLLWSYKLSNKLNKTFVILCLTLAVMYCGIGVLALTCGKNVVVNVLSQTEFDAFVSVMEVSTSAFWPVVLQAVIFVAYFVCNGMLHFDQDVLHCDKTTYANKRKRVSLENAKVDLLIRYDQLRIDGVITDSEFQILKERLLEISLSDPTAEGKVK